MLDSPFFAPQFIQLSSLVRPQTRVALISRAGQPLAFWPYEAVGRNAQPVAALVTEIAGVIAADGLAWNPRQHLKALGLRNWAYDCIPASQSAFHPYDLCQSSYSYISLEAGYTGYCQQLITAKSRQLEQNARKIRRIERERGPLRWVWHDLNPLALEQMFKWKREQYQRTGVTDVLGVPWVTKLLENIYGYQSLAFCGVLSTLYVGEQPIAIHFGMRNRHILASWFPVYDPQFSVYSPGTILLLKVIEEAARQGITRIDLGQGDERYKANFGNGSFTVAEGIVHRYPWDRLRLATWIRTRQIAQTNRYFRIPLRMFRALRNRQHGVQR